MGYILATVMAQSDECSLGIGENSGANFQVSQVSYPPLRASQTSAIVETFAACFGVFVPPCQPPRGLRGPGSPVSFGPGWFWLVAWSVGGGGSSGGVFAG